MGSSGGWNLSVKWEVSVPAGKKVKFVAMRARQPGGGGSPPRLVAALARELDLAHAAVYVDFYAGDVGGVLRRQEGYRSGDFFGLSEALHGNFGNNFLGEFINRFL